MLLALYDGSTRTRSSGTGGTTSISASASSSVHGGAGDLQRDLRALGIAFGTSELVRVPLRPFGNASLLTVDGATSLDCARSGSDEALANDVAKCSVRLAQSARDTQVHASIVYGRLPTAMSPMRVRCCVAAVSSLAPWTRTL